MAGLTLGIVKQVARTIVAGAHVVELLCSIGRDNRTAQQMGAPGDDFLPLPDDDVALADIGGGRVAIGWADTKNAGKAQEGERRLCSRNAAGVQVAEIWLKADGTIAISSLIGANVEINGTTFAPGGQVSTDGDVVAGGKSLATHGHLAGTLVAPSGGGTVTGATGGPK